MRLPTVVGSAVVAALLFAAAPVMAQDAPPPDGADMAMPMKHQPMMHGRMHHHKMMMHHRGRMMHHKKMMMHHHMMHKRMMKTM